MNIIRAHNLACPIDDGILEQRDKQLVCSHGHSFDIARQGYVNLLPVQHKRSKQPGDSKAMVLARTEFLNSGVYQGVASQLTDMVLAQLTDSDDACLLDAGCGEGYYLDRVLRAAKQTPGNKRLSFIGLDISKDAILQATKRNREISWLVGTNRQPPVAAESVDIILCLFGFLNYPGFNKILKSGGKVILLDPGPEHLQELRKIIYPEITKQQQTKLSLEESGFTLIDKQTLRFKTELTNKEQINHLLLMTPHFYRASKQGRDKAGQLEQLEITVDVIFRVLAKQAIIDD